MVSILCITYNHEKYIKQALDGFVNQKTDFKFEVIIHDDASTDSTADIIKEYEKKYPDIIKPIYQSENQYSKGLKITKDILIPLIKGKYVAICEGDDYWCDDNKLQKQVDFLENNKEYSACVHAYKLFDMVTKKFIDKHSFEYTGEVTASQVILGDGHLFATNSVVCRSEVFCQYPPFRCLSPVGDYPMMILLSFSGKIFYFDDIMSVYRFRVPGSWTERNMMNVEKMGEHVKKMAVALEEADKYSEYKYHEEFRNVIDKKFFNYYCEKGASLRFLKKNYEKYYSQKSTKEKIRIALKKYVPFIWTVKKEVSKWKKKIM